MMNDFVFLIIIIIIIIEFDETKQNKDISFLLRVIDLFPPLRYDKQLLPGFTNSNNDYLLSVSLSSSSSSSTIDREDEWLAVYVY